MRIEKLNLYSSEGSQTRKSGKTADPNLKAAEYQLSRSSATETQRRQSLQSMETQQETSEDDMRGDEDAH